MCIWLMRLIFKPPFAYCCTVQSDAVAGKRNKDLMINCTAFNGYFHRSDRDSNLYLRC